MQHEGKITEWKDDKGYGFVTPKGGGPKVFVHIKSFANRQRRPVGDELVTYELASDAHGRPQGVNVAFVGDRQRSRSARAAPGPGLMAFSFAILFIAFVAGAVAVGRLPLALLVAYAIVSVVAFLAYLFDKAAALKGTWRIKENTLHLFALLGGWPGAMLAQRTLRHKTQKLSFQLAYWLTVLLNCAGLGWLLLSPTGIRFMKTVIGVV